MTQNSHSEAHGTTAEPMNAFFDARAGSYDRHMRENVEHFDEFYGAVARLVTPTSTPICILDLGCGTGLELPPILRRAPHAIITGVDLSPAMLARLRARFGDDLQRPSLRLVQASYLDLPLGAAYYDYALSVMTLHHLLPGVKRALYRKIRRALKPGGRYIEGDWIVSPAAETAYLEKYRRHSSALGADPAGNYHIDIPASRTTQQRLLGEAGFAEVDTIWRKNTAAVYTGVKA